jgi:uncharacterized membrane protein YhaH (DUF805 family)
MTAPAPSTSVAPRRAFWWGLVVIGLVLAVSVGVMLIRGASGALGRIGQPAEPVITQQIVVERLRDVAKLVAT